MTKLMIEQIPVLSDNYVYLLYDPEREACAAVDPAAAEPVLERLAAKGWRLTHILNTHHHGDHTGANLELKRLTGCTVIGAARDHGRIPGMDVGVAQGDTVRLGGAQATVLEVPGHTSGHMAFWFPESRALFCGDTLFSLGCGRLFEGTPAQMWDSLKRLRALPPDTLVHCAHEYTKANGRFAQSVDPDNEVLAGRVANVAQLRERGLPTIPSLMAKECAANPFLRADTPCMARSMGLEPGTDPALVFAELRRRKDIF